MPSFGRQARPFRVDGVERGVGGPHLVRTGSLSVVLLASFELHLRRLGQTFFTQDAVDGGLRDAEAPVVGDPRSQWTAAQTTLVWPLEQLAAPSA